MKTQNHSRFSLICLAIVAVIGLNSCDHPRQRRVQVPRPGGNACHQTGAVVARATGPIHVGLQPTPGCPTPHVGGGHPRGAVIVEGGHDGPPGHGVGREPGNRRVITTQNPNVLRVRYDGKTGLPKGSAVVPHGAPADLPVKKAGPNEGVIMSPEGRVLTAPPGVEITPDQVAAIMAAQGAYRPGQPARRRSH